MSTYIRHRVSQNRHRYIKDNFDLDLTYIEPNIIAMGYPSDRMLPGLVRNQIDDVTEFLKLRHNGAYKVYNLCDKPYYNLKHFEKVELVPMQDHNPPKFYQIESFCKSARDWLNAKPNNVVIVHCKAGKGRTGTMIACYLLFSRKFESPFDAMSYFDNKRCQDKKGVTIPSQRRYIEYYADLLKNSREYVSEELLLKSVQITYPEKSTYDFYKTLQLRIFKDRTVLIYKSKEIKPISKTTKFLYEFAEPLLLVDDVKASFHNSNLGSKKNCVFYLSFNVFGLLQNNSYADDFRSSFGKKVQGDDGDIYWSLKKTLIDVAYKNSGLDPEFEATFRFARPTAHDKPAIGAVEPRPATLDRHSKDSSLYRSMNKTDSSSSSSSESCDQVCEAAAQMRLASGPEQSVAAPPPSSAGDRNSAGGPVPSPSPDAKAELATSKGDVSSKAPEPQPRAAANHRFEPTSDSGAAAAFDDEKESRKSDKSKLKTKSKSKGKNKNKNFDKYENDAGGESSSSDEQSSENGSDKTKSSSKKKSYKLKLIPKILKMSKF